MRNCHRPGAAVSAAWPCIGDGLGALRAPRLISTSRGQRAGRLQITTEYGHGWMHGQHRYGTMSERHTKAITDKTDIEQLCTGERRAEGYAPQSAWSVQPRQRYAVKPAARTGRRGRRCRIIARSPASLWIAFSRSPRRRGSVQKGLAMQVLQHGYDFDALVMWSSIPACRHRSLSPITAR